jgi:hypothetical protein
MRELEVLGNGHLKLDFADCKDFFTQDLTEMVRCRLKRLLEQALIAEFVSSAPRIRAPPEIPKISASIGPAFPAPNATEPRSLTSSPSRTRCILPSLPDPLFGVECGGSGFVLRNPEIKSSGF